MSIIFLQKVFLKEKMQKDILHEKYLKRTEILSENDIYLTSLNLLENTLQYYALVLSQFNLFESEKKIQVKWDLLDSAKSLIITLNKRLDRLIPNAQKEITFWFNQTFDFSHKMLILANVEDLNFSLKNLKDSFQSKVEMLSDEDVNNLKLKYTIKKLSDAQKELEFNIQWANKMARKKYLNENLNKVSKRKLLNKYFDFIEKEDFN